MGLWWACPSFHLYSHIYVFMTLYFGMYHLKSFRCLFFAQLLLYTTYNYVMRLPLQCLFYSCLTQIRQHTTCTSHINMWNTSVVSMIIQELFFCYLLFKFELRSIDRANLHQPSNHKIWILKFEWYMWNYY